MEEDRFQRAIALIDEANGADPNVLVVAGAGRPKELAHAELVSAWVRRLVDDPSEPLLLAARAHHIRRWQRPRADFPRDRRGYLRWRTGLYIFQAAQVRAILESVGYEEDTVVRAEALVAKALPLTDPDAAALEDAICLVFLETQLAEFAGRTEREKMLEILRKTWRKISPNGRTAALTLPLDAAERALVEAALDAGGETS